MQKEHSNQYQVKVLKKVIGNFDHNVETYKINNIKNMKKLLLLFLFINISTFAQDEFYKTPLKGKITAYTVSKLSGDSLNPTFTIVEKVSYDKNGRMLTSFKGSRRSQSTEANIFNGSTVTNYKCRCSDIDAFIKNFTIRDNAELKKMQGYGSGQEPTKFVKITQLDKGGNAAVVGDYSESGYKTSETKSWYDASKNAVRIERYDIDGNLEETVLNVYNKSGKLASQKITKAKEGEYKHAWLYDKGGNNIEFLTYQDGVLKNHQKHSVSAKGSDKEFHSTDALTDATHLEKQVSYDTAGRETKVINFNADGSKSSQHEFVYDKSGNLKTYSIYYKENVLSTKYEYTADAKGNAIEVKKHQLVIYHVDGKKEPRYETSKYMRKIEYGK